MNIIVIGKSTSGMARFLASLEGADIALVYAQSADDASRAIYDASGQHQAAFACERSSLKLLEGAGWRFMPQRWHA